MIRPDRDLQVNGHELPQLQKIDILSPPPIKDSPGGGGGEQTMQLESPGPEPDFNMDPQNNRTRTFSKTEADSGLDFDFEIAGLNGYLVLLVVAVILIFSWK